MKKKMELKVYSLMIFLLTTLISCSIDTTTNKESNMNPVPEYQNYFFTNNGALFGLTESGIDRIVITEDEENLMNITDFFIKGGDLYFTENKFDNSDPENPVDAEVYHKQSGGEVSVVKSLPTRPALDRSQLNTEEFTIENFDYQGTMCSDVRNLITESGIERFFMVDGISHFPGVGLFFNVSDGRYNETTMVRDKALYFWPVDKPSINIVNDPGELW